MSENKLGLRHQRDEAALGGGDAGLPDHRAPAAMHRDRLAGDAGAERRGAMKLVLLSIVVVPAPSGRLRIVPVAPSVSAKAMIAPHATPRPGAQLLADRQFGDDPVGSGCVNSMPIMRQRAASPI